MPSQAKKSKPNRRRDDATQSKLFIKKAREIGADEKKSRADKLIGKLAEKPPEPRTKDD